MSIKDLEMLFKFAGGLGMFLYGMNVMADGLQKSAGQKMHRLLEVLTGNRFLGVLVGAVVTAIIQSSSATTVMVVGFVNAGLINLTQAVGVIMGANIGTTITSWLVSMNEWGEMLKPEFFAPLIVGVGALLCLFGKNERKKKVGEILVGFGVLFIGLSFMSASIKPYRDAPIFSSAFTILGQNPILGVLAGALVTAVIQSSSASVGILQTLAANGIVNWRSAVFITLGQNIGTCVTALISSAGAHRTAKQAAVIHLLFNISGAVIFGLLMFGLFQVNTTLAVASINSVEISVFHTVFNISNTLLLFPFANLLVKASCLIVPESKAEQEEEKVEEEVRRHLDERILSSPSFAIETVSHEVVRMGRLAQDNLKAGANAILYNDETAVAQVVSGEKSINKLERILTEYLVMINNLSLSEEQHLVVKNLFYTINDIERISDHCENLSELAEIKIRDQITFSDVATRELTQMIEASSTAVKHAVNARETMEMSEVRQVVKYEDIVDNLEEELRESHIERLSTASCHMEYGIVFLDALSNLERISDHAHNIAGYVREEL